MKNQAGKRKTAAFAERAASGGGKPSVGFKQMIEEKVSPPSSKEGKQDAVSHLNHNLLLLERQVAFFNFAIQEITEIAPQPRNKKLPSS